MRVTLPRRLRAWVDCKMAKQKPTSLGTLSLSESSKSLAAFLSTLPANMNERSWDHALLGPCAEINTPIPVVSGLLPHQDKIFQTHRFLYKQILKTWCKEIVPISLPQTGFSRGCEQAPFRSRLCFQYMLHSKTPGLDLNGIFILLPSFAIVHCFEGSSLFFKDMNRCNKSS